MSENGNRVSINSVDTQNGEPMSEIELSRLSELETVVENGLHTFYNVGMAFPLAERRADISFSNHSECASLQGEQRNHAMNMLATGKWNRANVRAWKKELRGEPSKPKTKTVTVNPVNYYSDGKRLIVTFDCADVPQNVISWHVKVEAA